ncbi:hypothetical protein BRYFOR_07159 [Marvinbryantia formatexigens DSM 14469]|uniref:Uncharacterized protein n=1 Tax=Marvinbryantia formatexigens DSM 14469 TaxID=478749 RepID=C6LEV8_9FIRM|nr:DUF6171 family protein [Marvinbryantia formatexigens]EET60697.1 hypothetical protein BRYFOR_07159 [Marvinbryantia formatexigens DSM 14469]UWO23008.1 DUF6171 family protein [Marvinbryantia formatexigens DSM 14469]SDG35362.1 hypothetical protein SAMN05660368_02414 [Marvinbryantia formatexigens]
MSEGLRVCRKCLLREQTEAEYFKNLESYIAGLPEEVRVSQQIYEERLACCSHCENQMQGMCRLCGCFVELRAAMKVRKCPALPCRWNAVP